MDKDKLSIFFRYSVYLLLTLNIYFFFQEESLAAKELFSGGINTQNFIDAFSSTIDTGAWVLLIWLFELETAVIPDEKLEGSLKWWLMAARAIGYGFIGYALIGYINTLIIFLQIQPFTTEDLCLLMNQGVTYVEKFDKYLPLTPEICSAMNQQALYVLPNTQIVGTGQAMQAAMYLALADVINAITWVLVVLVLEIEVFLQLRHELSPQFLKGLGYIKAVLYSTLLVCAIYWGFEGDFIDFWDAFLWLVAFVFIELNIFNWNEETNEKFSSEAGAL